MAPELTHSYLLTIIARPERAKRGIDGNLWRRGSCHACEEKQPCSVDVLPGRASAIQAIHGMALAGLKAHHRNNSGRVHSTAGGRVPPATCPWSTGTQDNKDGASLSSCFTFSEHVFQRLWSERGVFQCATCDRANTLPKWQREPHACFPMLAGDDGDPFAQEDPLDESEEAHKCKREPTHPEGIVRRAPREPFGAGKWSGAQWLLKMSHGKASFSVATEKFGAYQCSDS